MYKYIFKEMNANFVLSFIAKNIVPHCVTVCVIC